MGTISFIFVLNKPHAIFFSLLYIMNDFNTVITLFLLHHSEHAKPALFENKWKKTLLAVRKLFR